MISLNFPDIKLELTSKGNKVYIFDIIRKKTLLLTPEEWVRQHTIHYLIYHLGYPKALIKIEGGLRVNKLLKRTDILVFNSWGNAWMIIECKSYSVKLNNEVFYQLSAYNSTHNARFLVITNGLKHICAEVDYSNKKIIPLEGFPAFQRD
jgi:hypothetical protein